MGTTKYLSPGAIRNPVEGLASSLTNLGNMYGEQSERKQKQELDAAVQAESARRFDITNARSEQTFANAENKRLAGENFNKWAMSDASDKHVFDNSSMDKDTAKYVSDLQSRLSKEQKELTDSIGSGKVDTKLFRQNLLDSGLSETEAGNRVLERTSAITSASNDLYGLGDKERIAKINTYSDSMYKPRFDAIQNDIDTGKHLSRGERVRAMFKSLDPEMVASLPYERLNKVIGDKVGGLTIAEMNASEAARVSQANETAKYNIDNQVKIYNKVNKSRGASSANFTGKDLDNYVKELDGLDIGWWDNKNAKKAAAALIDEGHHPSAVISVIKENVNSGIDNTFFDKDKDSAAYNKLSAQALSRSNSLSKNKSTGYTKLTEPGNYRPEAPRSIGDIRKMRMRYGTNLRLKDYAPKENTSAAYMVDPNTGIGPSAYTASKPLTAEESDKIFNEKISSYDKLSSREKSLTYPSLSADMKSALLKRAQGTNYGDFAPASEYAINPEASTSLGGLRDILSTSSTPVLDAINKNKSIDRRKTEDRNILDILNNASLVPDTSTQPSIFTQPSFTGRNVLNRKPNTAIPNRSEGISRDQALMSRNLENSENLRNRARSIAVPETKIENIDMSVSEMQESPEKAKEVIDMLLPGGSYQGFMDFLEDVTSTNDQKEKAFMEANYRNGAYERLKKRAKRQLSAEDLATRDILKTPVPY